MGELLTVALALGLVGLLLVVLAMRGRKTRGLGSGETVGLDDVTLFSERLKLVGRPDRIDRDEVLHVAGEQPQPQIDEHALPRKQAPEAYMPAVAPCRRLEHRQARAQPPGPRSRDRTPTARYPPLPVLPVALERVIQELLLDAVQVQPVTVETFTAPLPPPTPDARVSP